MKKTDNLHILDESPLISPVKLKESLPMTEASNTTVVQSREVIKGILTQKDRRLLAIVGPCSIHDYKAATEYALRLKELHRELSDRLYILMRVYFEKPRTTIGWRGMIIDPHLDGSCDIAEGLSAARRLLLETTELGLPAATEMLDPIVPQYIADLISWTAIGARTTESQTHRDMASGLSMPVGFKNNTDGNLQIAIDAMSSAQHPHSFLGIDQEGKTCVLKTSGNPHTHIILRGSRSRTNYKKRDIKEAAKLLKKAGFDSSIMVDCSHGNSNKKQQNQEIVLRSILNSRNSGLESIIGFMLESNLREGNQEIPGNMRQLTYGISITDECIGWEKTEELLKSAYESLHTL
jgi:3-deoxy-7-phosphoheptulonate synthase